MTELAKKKAKKTNKKQKSKVKVYIGLILGLVILVVLVYMVRNQFQEESEIAAVVNGEVITYAEIETIFDQLPPEYQGIITKNEILDQKINEILLLQEASNRAIKVDDEEINSIINTIISQSGMTKGEFESKLSQQGINQANLREFYKTQLMILKLLNETALNDIEVGENEITGYYAESGVEDSGISFEEARDQIEIVLLAEKREEAFLDYVEELKSQSDIEIFFGADTFETTNNEVCKENGKPVIRLFTTSKCEQCDWIEETFILTIEPYLASEEITAYYWELDTGDNKLTLEKESSIPKSEVELFKSLSPSLKVPAFNFGCKYVRVGTGYFDEGSLASEESEFNLIINKLLAQ